MVCLGELVDNGKNYLYSSSAATSESLKGQNDRIDVFVCIYRYLIFKFNC